MTRRQRRALAPGRVLAPGLTMIGALDAGGHAPVYIVWNHRAWCPMALKLFRSAARATEESGIMAAVAHPNIVRCLGGGARPAHLLMEFLEGPLLKSLIKTHPNGALGVSDAARVAIHIGAALTHMHQRDILHLDVKPSNVIVTAGGRPMLFDLGTARRRADWAIPCIEGTDFYMAPEQCVRAAPVTPATDVFGLGVTLYEMLTGKLPFPRGTARRPFPQIMTDATPARHYRPSLPSALDALMLRCLARDPAARPASPADILPLLHDFIRSGPPMWPVELRLGTAAKRAAAAMAAPRRRARRSA